MQPAVLTHEVGMPDSATKKLHKESVEKLPWVKFSV